MLSFAVINSLKLHSLFVFRLVMSCSRIYMPIVCTVVYEYIED